MADRKIAYTGAPPARQRNGSSGPRRALIALYATFALAATARAIVQLATKYHQAPLAYLLSLFSGLVYISATVGLTTSRRWSRGLTWVSCSIELAGVLAIGLLSILDAVAFPDDTVWSDFGGGYFYIPVVLPLLALGWLWHTRRPAGTDATPLDRAGARAIPADPTGRHGAGDGTMS